MEGATRGPLPWRGGGARRQSLGLPTSAHRPSSRPATGERVGCGEEGSPGSGRSRGAPAVTAESQPDWADGKSAPRQVRGSVHPQEHVPGPRGSRRAQGQGSANCLGAEGAGGGTDRGCAALGAQEAQQIQNPTRASGMIRAWFWKTSPPQLPAPSRQPRCGEGASGGTRVAERMGGVEQEKHPQQGPSVGRRGAARWHTHPPGSQLQLSPHPQRGWFSCSIVSDSV